MNSSLATSIKKKLEETHLTAGKVEKLAGLKINAVRNILNGTSQNPSVLTLKAIATVFNCSIDELLENEHSVEVRLSSYKENKPILTLDDLDLFLKVTNLVAKIIRENGYKITVEQALNLIRGIYSYSAMEKKNTINMEFVTWLFQNMHDS
jgi:transcriptional regulator with XRE-family HTH domain